MEFTPKKQVIPSYKTGSTIRHNPYSTEGRNYISRFKKRTESSSASPATYSGPRVKTTPRRFTSRADRIINNSSCKTSPSNKRLSNLGKWIERKGTSPHSAKRPFSAVNGLEKPKDFYDPNESDSEVIDIKKKTSSDNDPYNIFSDSDNKTSDDKENTLFSPLKTTPLKPTPKNVYFNKMKTVPRSRFLCEVSPERVSDKDILQSRRNLNSDKATHSVFSDSDSEPFEKQNKNSLFSPPRLNKKKEYTFSSKKKPVNLARSKLLNDISPEKVDRAYCFGTKYSSVAEKENVPTLTKDLSSEITQPHLIGFPNYGNTCYLNSVLQALFGLPPFVSDYQMLASELSMPPTSLCHGLTQIVSSRTKGQMIGVKHALRMVKENLVRVDGSFSGYKMQDANEVLTRILDTTKDEIDRCHMTTPSPDRLQDADSTFPLSGYDVVDEDIALSGRKSRMLEFSKDVETISNSSNEGNGGEKCRTDNKGYNGERDNSYSEGNDQEKFNNVNEEEDGKKDSSSNKDGREKGNTRNACKDLRDGEDIVRAFAQTNITSPSEKCKLLCEVAITYNSFEKETGLTTPTGPTQVTTPCKASENSMPRNPVKDNFEFQLLESYRCLGCGKVVGRNQEYFGLYVNLPEESQDTIQDAIGAYMGADERELKCGSCGHNQSSVVTSITRLPRILIVQLKRYEYKAELSESIKRSSRVQVNRWLSLDPHMTEDVAAPSLWDPQASSCVTPRTPKPATLTVRNLSSELNVCEGLKDQEELPNLSSPIKEPEGATTTLTAEKEDEELQEVMRRSMDEVGGAREEDEIQQAIRLSLQDLGMNYTQENQVEGQDEEHSAKDPWSAEIMKESCHSYCLISIISHFGLTTNTGHYVADVYNCDEDTWLHYDDECVSKIPESVVFAEGRQKNGYIFFYIHKNLLQKIGNKSNPQR